MSSKHFRGEVWSNVHPAVMQAIVKVNEEEGKVAIGQDRHTLNAISMLQSHFRQPIYVTFAYNGTAANILALKAMTSRDGVVLCTAQAHINTNENGALEYTLGNKILSIECPEEKMTPELFDSLLKKHKKYHYNPQVLAITQPTELGTVYSLPELSALVARAHAENVYVYVDGARLGCGLDATGATLSRMLEETEVDAFSLGGTKAGAMFGEMIVFRRPQFARNIEYLRKQSFQHFDKQQFMGAQFECLLENDLWLKNAHLANTNARILAEKLKNIGILPYYPVESNMFFCQMSPSQLQSVNQVYDLHYWDAEQQVVRIATGFYTREECMDELVSLLGATSNPTVPNAIPSSSL